MVERKRNNGATKHHAKPVAATRTKPSGATPAIFPAEETIGFLIWDTSRAVTREFTQRITRHGLSFGLWPFLRALWEEDGLSQRQLSERVRMKGPTTVAAINRLEAKGFVRRVADPRDGRRINVYLTEKGRRTFDVAMPEVEAVNRRSLARLAKSDQETIKTYLRTIRANIGRS
ncbi:MAG: MarR family transcriptional regulator [Alphaproteobacteria bacterium]|nr:MarR family transcriptional regulator [Alphaproteobacteria bacterium]